MNRGWLIILQYAGQPLTEKNDLAQNVQSGKVEEGKKIKKMKENHLKTIRKMKSYCNSGAVLNHFAWASIMKDEMAHFTVISPSSTERSGGGMCFYHVSSIPLTVLQPSPPRCLVLVLYLHALCQTGTSVAMVSPFLGLFYIVIWLLGCLT